MWSNIHVFLYGCICLGMHVDECVHVHRSSRKSSKEQHRLLQHGFFFFLGKEAKCYILLVST